MKPTVRAGIPSDVPALFRVRTAVTENAMSIDELANVGITPETVTDMIKTGAAGCWVAESNGEVVGFSMSKRAEREVFALFVHPGHENQGLGTMLIEAAVEWLREQSTQVIRLSTDIESRAHAFYRKRGWFETHRDAQEVYLAMRFET